MGYYKPDLYNQPENFGLVPVGELEDPEACYSFNTLVVWHHPGTNTLYWATDSGCSCPSPFEDVTSLSDAVQAHFDNETEMAALGDAIRSHCDYTQDEWRHKATGEIALDRVRLLDKIRSLATEAATR